MKKRYSYFLGIVLFSASITMVSCSDGDSETIKVSSIHVADDKGTNIKAANDMSTFNLRDLIAEQLPGADRKVIDGVSWKANSDTEDSGVDFELVLNEDALKQKDSIVSIVKRFLDKTSAQYNKTIPQMDEVETAAEYYMHLIEGGNVDTIWTKISPTLTRFASKDDFRSSVEQRAVLFKPKGKRKVENRRLAGELGPDIKGNFYTLVFVYENDEHEEVTLEKIGNEYKLLGYRFYVKK